MIRSLEKYCGSRRLPLSNKMYLFGIDDVLLGTLALAGASVAGAGISSAVNAHNTKKTNTANQDINERNIEYNTAMTQAQWARDDNAHQREVADLQAAGLSPLANLQGSGVSSALGAPTPIAMQAPQIDTNALVQAVLGSQQLEEQKRQFNISSGQKDMEIANEAKRISIESQKVQLEDKKINNEYHIAMEQNALRAKEVENAVNQLEEIKRYNSEEQRRKETERLYNEYHTRSMQMYQDAMKNCPEFCSGIKWCKTIEEWQTAQDSLNATYDALTKELGSMSNANSSFFTELGGEMSGGVGSVLPGVNGKVQGDINAGLSRDNSNKRSVISDKYKSNMKFPVLVSPKDLDLFDEDMNLKYSNK